MSNRETEYEHILVTTPDSGMLDYVWTETLKNTTYLFSLLYHYNAYFMVEMASHLREKKQK